MNNVGSILQILFVILMIAGPGIGWVIKKLQEQSQVREALLQRERRREEELRTGRRGGPESGHSSSPGSQRPPAATPNQRLQELKERRARQLEEMRQRQQRGSVSVGSPPMPARLGVPPAASGGPSPPRIPVPVSGPRRGRKSTRTVAPAPPPSISSSTVSGLGSRATDKPPALAPTGSIVAAVTAAASGSAKGRTASGEIPSSGSLGSAADLKRAVILTELLGRPLALRDDQPGPLDRLL